MPEGIQSPKLINRQRCYDGFTELINENIITYFLIISNHCFAWKPNTATKTASDLKIRMLRSIYLIAKGLRGPGAHGNQGANG